MSFDNTYLSSEDSYELFKNSSSHLVHALLRGPQGKQVFCCVATMAIFLRPNAFVRRDCD